MFIYSTIFMIKNCMHAEEGVLCDSQTADLNLKLFKCTFILTLVRFWLSVTRLLRHPVKLKLILA